MLVALPYCQRRLVSGDADVAFLACPVAMVSLVSGDRGAAAVRADRRGFARVMWESWSPKRWFAEATFDRVVKAFDNPEWADVTIHSYRSRWDEAEPDARSVWLEDKVRATRQLALPTIYFQGELDGVNPPEMTVALAEKFTADFERILRPSVGHFPTREAPLAIAVRLAAHFHA